LPEHPEHDIRGQIAPTHTNVNYSRVLRSAKDHMTLPCTLNDDHQYDLGEPGGPFSLAAVCESGSARLVVLSRIPFQHHNYDQRDNTPLMRAFLGWLIGPRS
jgi:hypothetical protein